MSEKLHITSPEHQRSPEKHHQKAEKEHLKKLHEKAKNTKETSKQTIEQIQRSIESTAISGEEFSVGEKEAKQPSSYGISKHVKKDAYKQVIKKTQSKLSKPEKNFSKVIHSPTVEKISDIGAKTVARPSGILFGGAIAFIGSLILFLISKRSGFTYNYLFFVLVFVGGYLVGLIIELLYKATKLKN